MFDALVTILYWNSRTACKAHPQPPSPSLRFLTPLYEHPGYITMNFPLQQVLKSTSGIV